MGLALDRAEFAGFLLRGVFGEEAHVMRVNHGPKTKKFPEQFLRGAKGKILNQIILFAVTLLHINF